MPTTLLKQNTISRQSLRQMAPSHRLYALLDACDAPAVPDKMMALGEERAVSLYRGMAEEEWSAFAPYLAVADDALLEWIGDTLWTEPWGVFVLADTSLTALRKHFRHFLIVDDPQGEEMYFRFYDPRVLHKYLPTCTARELKAFYGEIEAFLITSSEAEADVEGGIQALSRVPDVWSPSFVQPARRVGERFPIRNEQMDVFAPEAEAAFERRLMDHLRAHHAQSVKNISDAPLLQMVRKGIACAKRYDMRWESNLMAFVALMFEIAPNFDRHPRMQMILASRQIPPEKKLDVLLERTPEATWKEAVLNYDGSLWREAMKDGV